MWKYFNLNRHQASIQDEKPSFERRAVIKGHFAYVGMESTCVNRGLSTGRSRYRVTLHGKVRDPLNMYSGYLPGVYTTVNRAGYQLSVGETAKGTLRRIVNAAGRPVRRSFVLALRHSHQGTRKPVTFGHCRNSKAPAIATMRAVD